MKPYRTEFGDDVDVCAGVLLILGVAGGLVCAAWRLAAEFF